MLTAIIIISLLSLLVATEAEPSRSARVLPPNQRLLPKRNGGAKKADDADQLAA